MITYGYCARSFILQGIPTIIIGPYGFGGWATPDNMEYLFKDNFKGRPGARLNESIPFLVLLDELMEIKECEDLEGLLKKNICILKSSLDRYSVKNISESIKHFEDIYLQINDKIQRELLKPRLASNVFIVGKEILFWLREKCSMIYFFVG